eukprot:g29269.t1
MPGLLRELQTLGDWWTSAPSKMFKAPKTVFDQSPQVLEAAPPIRTRPGRSTWDQAHCASFLAGAVHFHAPIDTAAATSTYTTSSSDDDLPGPFASKQALHPGSGYWCSTGTHDPDELVTWTGIMHKRRKVRAVKVSWAYAPGQVRVRTTPDGRHWETVGSKLGQKTYCILS